jgi:hypothetical protein
MAALEDPAAAARGAQSISSIHAPSSPVNLGGGTPGTMPAGGMGASGASGLFRFEGMLNLDVDSTSVFELVDVDGRIDPSGAVEFQFATEEIADLFASSFTLDSFFVEEGSPVSDVTPFTLLTFSATSPARTFDVTLNNDRTFTTFAHAAGDANGDGWVDGLDYLIWAGNFGDDPADDPPGSPGNGDFDDDGNVDGLDYLAWAGNYGTHTSSVAVPEPGTWGLLLWGLTTLAARRRRRSAQELRV